MTRRRPIKNPTYFTPLSFYFDMMQASMQNLEMLTSSAQVIAYRTELISRAAQGDTTIDYRELTTMWMEKIAAGNEAWAIAVKQLSRSNPTTSLFKDWMHTMAPYHKRASANARRLSKK